MPAVINIAFSGERKPEAWHVKLVNRQVSRGFNKSAPITIMLPLKIWRHLLKKNNRQLWLDAIQESQIHIHGDDAGKQAVMRFFGANIAAVNGEKPSVRKMSKAKLNGAAAKNGTAQKNQHRQTPKARNLLPGQKAEHRELQNSHQIRPFPSIRRFNLFVLAKADAIETTLLQRRFTNSVEVQQQERQQPRHNPQPTRK